MQSHHLRCVRVCVLVCPRPPPHRRQPYFCHVINASLTKSPKYLDRYVVIKRLCLIGGGMLFARFLLAGLPGYSTMDVSNFKSTEWLRGDKLCTFRGKYHLAWVRACPRCVCVCVCVRVCVASAHADECVCVCF